MPELMKGAGFLKLKEMKASDISIYLQLSSYPLPNSNAALEHDEVRNEAALDSR